jgi:N-acetylneuraminic acid mutarotase
MKNLFLIVLVLVLIVTSCRKEDTPRNSWKTLKAMPTARHHLGFVECNNLLYAIGGYNADGLNKVEVYNPANDTWQTKAPMPTARGYLVVAAVSNKIYAIGGITGGDLGNITYTNVTEEYDPALDKWTVKSPFPITAVPPNSVLGNQFITGTAINGKIYVVVGTSDGSEPTYIYDPVNDKWSRSGKTVAQFNFEPYFSTADDSNMYVYDGNEFLQYRSVDNEWRVLQPFLTSRKAACLSYYDNNVYSIGGYIIPTDSNINNITLGNVEAYNLTSSSWKKTASLNTERHSAAAVSYNQKLYVVGGQFKQRNYQDVTLADLEVLSIK